MSGEVEGRREVASLEVVGGCRFVPFLDAVLVRALGRAGRESGRKSRSGRNTDLHTVRVVVVRLQGTSARVRQHAVVPQVVLQVPDVRIRDARATLGGDGSERFYPICPVMG